MKLKHFLQLIILFLFFAIPTAFSQLTDTDVREARFWAEGKGKQIVDILTSTSGDKYQRLDNILHNDVDLEYAAKFVIGKYWRQMSEEQQETYLDLFDRYVSAAYKTYPLNIQEGDVSFTVDKILPENKIINIFCTVFVKNIEQNVDEQSQGGIKVIFALVKDGDSFKVRDLKIQESSFLQSYRTRFYKMIHEDSDDEIEWFLEDFENLVIENENNS